MKVVKFQQEVLAQVDNNHVKYVRDSDYSGVNVMITVDGTYAYCMPESVVMLNLDKIGCECKALEPFLIMPCYMKQHELLWNVDWKMALLPLYLTRIMLKYISIKNFLHIVIRTQNLRQVITETCCLLTNKGD